MFFDSRALDSFDQYLRDVERYPLIENPKTEREIARKARAGDRQSAERLVTANLRFVISYVKKYQGRVLAFFAARRRRRTLGCSCSWPGR